MPALLSLYQSASKTRGGRAPGLDIRVFLHASDPPLPGRAHGHHAAVEARRGLFLATQPARRVTAEIARIYQALIDFKSDISDTMAMPPEQSLPLPVIHALRKLGRDLAVARRKRRFSTVDMASRLFVSRDTLWRLERGDPTVAVGTLATALFVLQLHDRLANLTAPETDALGLTLEEERLPKRIRKSLK